MSIDIHHIFPKAYCEKQGFKRHVWNSSVNKAPLPAKTNRTIGGKAPSEYLAAIKKNYRMEPNRLDDILRTHRIAPELLRTDAFVDFIRERAGRLLDLIAEATGKSIGGRDSDEVLSAFGGWLPSFGATSFIAEPASAVEEG